MGSRAPPPNSEVGGRGLRPEASFLKVLKSFRARKAVVKSQTVWFLSCFYPPILNMNRGSPPPTRGFRRIHLTVLRNRWTKNVFAGPKSFRGIRETGSRLERAAKIKPQYFDLKFSVMNRPVWDSCDKLRTRFSSRLIFLPFVRSFVLHFRLVLRSPIPNLCISL